MSLATVTLSLLLGGGLWLAGLITMHNILMRPGAETDPEGWILEQQRLAPWFDTGKAMMFVGSLVMLPWMLQLFDWVSRR